jgi:nucleoside-diphosphate-sugar epimerase
MIKNILVTGNLGYIGSVLVPQLTKKYHVTGFDIGYFKDCNLEKIKKIKNFKQIYKDIRNIDKDDLKNIDCVVHLAALSNDPLGQFNHKTTIDINYKGTKKLADIAKKNGIKKFIFISSQSIYGISKKAGLLDEYKSKKNPITSYAKSKMLSEKYLTKIKTKTFQVFFLRPSTIFGASPRLRTDIILNNFLLNAYYNKKIQIISDGLPWRPILHVKDLCNVISNLISKNYKNINGKAFNIGLNGGNFRVIDLAIKVLKKLKGISVEIINTHDKDQRTYKVSFKRIYKLCGKNIINKNVDYGINEMMNYFKKISLKRQIIEKKTVRINHLKFLIKKGEINKNFEIN